MANLGRALLKLFLAAAACFFTFVAAFLWAALKHEPSAALVCAAVLATAPILGAIVLYRRIQRQEEHKRVSTEGAETRLLREVIPDGHAYDELSRECRDFGRYCGRLGMSAEEMGAALQVLLGNRAGGVLDVGDGSIPPRKDELDRKRSWLLRLTVLALALIPWTWRIGGAGPISLVWPALALFGCLLWAFVGLWVLLRMPLAEHLAVALGVGTAVGFSIGLLLLGAVFLLFPKRAIRQDADLALLLYHIGFRSVAGMRLAGAFFLLFLVCVSAIIIGQLG